MRDSIMSRARKKKEEMSGISLGVLSFFPQRAPAPGRSRLLIPKWLPRPLLGNPIPETDPDPEEKS
jgi:hypothetical protein